MEPAGLTLSVVGLAGFVSTIIDLLNYVSDAGSRDEDYETIKDLFELERGRFIQWVQIYNNHRRPKKEAKMILALQTDPSVQTIFRRMETLIVDGASIMEQYSLIKPDVSEDRRSKGSSRMIPLIYERLGRKSNTLPHRFRWVMRDREKFRALINDMTFLNDRFESLSRMRYKLEHRKPVHEESKYSSDQYPSTSLSIVPEIMDVVEPFSQACSTLEAMTGSPPCPYLGDSSDLACIGAAHNTMTMTNSCPGSRDYIKSPGELAGDFLKDALEYAPTSQFWHPPLLGLLGKPEIPGYRQLYGCSRGICAVCHNTLA